jgi:branched-subunit amino acid ABC-type transport system permease component
MNNMLPFIVIGLTTGSVYALAGVGLVLTYKTSGIFNFGHGSIAAIGAFVFYFLRQQLGIPWPFALALCLVVLGPVVGLLLELLARTLAHASTAIKVASTVGLVLIVLSIGSLWFPDNARTVSPFLPTQTIRIGGIYIGWNQIIIFGISLAVTGFLYYFFRFTRTGIAMRAVVDNAELLSRTGENPTRLRRIAWILGSCLAVASGILLAPSLNLDALVLTMLVVQAFGAAAIGRFTNLPLTYLGGLAIGIAGSLATNYTASYPSLSGVSASLPFVILLLVLVATPRARLTERVVKPSVEVHHSWVAPARIRNTMSLSGFRSAWPRDLAFYAGLEAKTDSR